MPNDLHHSHTVRTSNESSFDFICDVCGATDRSGSDLLSKPCSVTGDIGERLETLVNNQKASFDTFVALGQEDVLENHAAVEAALKVWKEHFTALNSFVNVAMPRIVELVRQAEKKPAELSDAQITALRKTLKISDQDNTVLTGELREWLIHQLVAWPTRIHNDRTTNDRYLRECAALMLAAETPSLMSLPEPEPCDFYLGKCRNCRREWTKTTEDEACSRPFGPFSKRR